MIAHSRIGAIEKDEIFWTRRPRSDNIYAVSYRRIYEREQKAFARRPPLAEARRTSPRARPVDTSALNDFTEVTMWRTTTFATALMGLALAAGRAGNVSPTEEKAAAPRYLRVSTAHWNINLYSAEAERIFRRDRDRRCAGVPRTARFAPVYRLMRADSSTTIAVAEWESEELGRAGAERYRAWMREVGIMGKIVLETRAGTIVAGS